MTQLPPELIALAKLLDAQTKPVQAAFQYCLVLMMVEAGKAELVATAPGEGGLICTFRTVAGDEFALVKPPISEEREAVIRKTLRTILDDEDAL
jgi:hypothetical protein